MQNTVFSKHFLCSHGIWEQYQGSHRNWHRPQKEAAGVYSAIALLPNISCLKGHLSDLKNHMSHPKQLEQREIYSYVV